MAYASVQGNTRRKRIQKKCEVEFIANKETYKGVSDNFSISGLFIKTDNLLDLHSLVTIKVHLPDGSTSNVEGRVTRVCSVSYDMSKASGQTLNGGMGIEIMQRDHNYIMFFMSLLSDNR
jgi:PilZ domain